MTGRLAPVLAAVAVLLAACQPAATIGPGGAPDRSRPRVIVSTDLATGLQDGWRPGVSDIDDGLAVVFLRAVLELLR